MRQAMLVALALLPLACASAPRQEPFQAKEVVPDARETLRVDQALVLVDASGSITSDSDFPEVKALVESFVGGMPQGSYDAGAITFGGRSRETSSLRSFDRGRLAGYARELRTLGESTPLPDVLREAADQLAGEPGRAAVILFSDGMPTVRGTPQDPERVLEAAGELVEARNGKVCFHTVQVGQSDEGAELLQQLAGLTECGSFRSLAEVNTPDSLYAFQTEVFLERAPALPAVSAAPSDLDGDGVIDARDQCPGTPRGARVDESGCWRLRGLHFATDSYAIGSADEERLDAVAAVLHDNPKLRIRIEGHTDATGPEGYNQILSEKRAQAVKAYLIATGIDAGRLADTGRGESQPVASNATREGRAENRRIELSVAD